MSYSAEITGRFTIEYKENGRTITVTKEPGYIENEFCMLVHRDSFQKWDDGTPIPEVEQQQKIDNLKAAIKEYDPTAIYIV